MKLRSIYGTKWCRRSESGKTTASHSPTKLKDSRPNPETICAKKGDARIASPGLARLSPKLREAIQMRDLDGFSMRDTPPRWNIHQRSEVPMARGRRHSVALHEFIAASQAAEQAAVPHSFSR